MLLWRMEMFLFESRMERSTRAPRGRLGTAPATIRGNEDSLAQCCGNAHPLTRPTLVGIAAALFVAFVPALNFIVPLAIGRYPVWSFTAAGRQ